MMWPVPFLLKMKIKFGEEYDLFLKGLSSPSPVSIRIHPLKNCSIAVDSGIPWSEHGNYLSARPSFTLDPEFHAGSYYVQEAGSQFLEKLFSIAIEEIQEPVVLDLCASPA